MKKQSLKDIQSSFAKAIRTPLTNKQKSKKILKGGSSFFKLAEKYIAPNDRLSSFERLEIYNRQYWFRLIDCLYDDFPGLRAIVGARHFHELVIAYLIKYPSRSYTLRNLGSRMEEFLKKNKKLCGARHLIAVEMARFEWAQIEAFDARELDLIDPAVLTSKKAQDLKLKLQPYIHLLELSYALDDLLLALRKEHLQRSEAGSEIVRDRTEKKVKLPERKKIYLVVHRFNNSLYYKRLDKAAFILLSEIVKVKSLGVACEIAFSYLPASVRNTEDAAKIIQKWFIDWTSLNWFSSKAKNY